MQPSEFLNRISIATPCPADWGRMEGDEQARFCGECHKHVYNISAMSAEDAVDLIQEKQGQLCVRLYRRQDGTVLVDDCPVGVARYWRRMKRVAAAVAAVMFFVGAAAVSRSAGHTARSTRRGPVARTMHQAVWQVKEWLGLNPPVFVTMGVMICPPQNRTIGTTPNPPSPGPLQPASPIVMGKVGLPRELNPRSAGVGEEQPEVRDASLPIVPAQN